MNVTGPFRPQLTPVSRQHLQEALSQREQETYDSMRFGKLFGLYLAMGTQPSLHPQDEVEFQKASSALLNSITALPFLSVRVNTNTDSEVTCSSTLKSPLASMEH